LTRPGPTNAASPAAVGRDLWMNRELWMSDRCPTRETEVQHRKCEAMSSGQCNI
jgi:hypothetical protein